MQPPEKKTERVEIAPPATDPAESEALSERAEEILEAVEARTRAAGLTGAGSAPSDSASGPGRATQKAASSESPMEVPQANPTTGSMQVLTGEDWANASAMLVQRQQEVTAACYQAELVRDGLAEFVEELAAAGDVAQEKFGRLVESLETSSNSFGPQGPLLRALSGRVDELAEKARQTIDDQLQRLTGLTADNRRAADGLRDQVNAAIADSRTAAAATLADRQEDLDGIRIVCERVRDEVRELDAQFKITLGDDAKRRESDHQMIQRTLGETTHQGCEALTSHGQSVLGGLTEKLEEQVRLTSTGAQQQMEATAAHLVVLDGLTEKLEEQVRLTATSAQQQMEAAAAHLVESTQQRIEKMEQRACGLEETYKTIADRLDLRERNLEEVEQRLCSLQAESDQAFRTLEARWKQGRSITDDMENELDTLHTRAVNTIERHQDAAGELETRLASVQDRLAGIEHARDQLTTTVEDSHERVAKLRAETESIHCLLDAESRRSMALVEDGRRGLDGLDTQASALTEHLEKTIASASSDVERMTHQASHAFGQLTEAIGACESAQRTTESTLTNIGATCQHAEKLHVALQEGLATAGNRMEHLTTLVERYEHANGQQQEQNDAGRCLTEQLESAIQDAHLAVSEQNQLVSETVAECDRTHQALRATLESGRRIDDQLVSLNQAGRQISAMVTGNITDAHAAADHLVATLQSATEGAAAIESRTHSTIDELRRVHEASETAVELHERRIKHAIDGGVELEKRMTGLQTDLAEKTEQAETAGEAARQGAQLVERGVGGMRQLLTTLSTTAEKVRTLNTESQQHQTKLSRALESAAEMTDSQKKQSELQQETTKTLTRQHDESRALLAELATAQDDAARSVKNVTEASAESARALEVFTELFAHAEAKQQMFEDGQRLAKQFVDQAGGIQETLDRLLGRSQRLENKLGSALAAPKQVVADADAHAQQLGDVCKAVRKVFAGLSKVSLEAHERVTTFKELRTAVDERIEQLQTHTATASDTLRHWVTEAAHAQERLAATLEHAPSIRATHPAGSLAALAGDHGNTASGTGVSTAMAVPATAPIESKVKTPQDADTISHRTTGTVEVDSADAVIQSADADGQSSAVAKMIDQARRRCGIST